MVSRQSESGSIWQNAIHLHGDIWLNVDLQWLSAGNGENARISSNSYLNVKLHKAIFKNSFSITLEANDIFDKNLQDFAFYNKDERIIISKTIAEKLSS